MGQSRLIETRWLITSNMSGLLSLLRSSFRAPLPSASQRVIRIRPSSIFPQTKANGWILLTLRSVVSQIPALYVIYFFPKWLANRSRFLDLIPLRCWMINSTKPNRSWIFGVAGIRAKNVRMHNLQLMVGRNFRRIDVTYCFHMTLAFLFSSSTHCTR